MEALLIGEILSIVMFVAVIAALMMGYPVVFTLAGTGFAFGVIGPCFVQQIRFLIFNIPECRPLLLGKEGVTPKCLHGPDPQLQCRMIRLRFDDVCAGLTQAV